MIATTTIYWKKCLGLIFCMLVVLVCLTSNVNCDEDSILDKKVILTFFTILSTFDDFNAFYFNFVKKDISVGE